MTKTRKAKLFIYVPIIVLTLSVVVSVVSNGLLFYDAVREDQSSAPTPEFFDYESYLQSNPSPTLSEFEFYRQPEVGAWQLYESPQSTMWNIGQRLKELSHALGLLSVIVGLVTVPIGIRWLRQEKKKKIIAAKM